MPVTPIKPLTLAYTAMEEGKARSGEAGSGFLRGPRLQPEDQLQISAQAKALAEAAPAQARGIAQEAPEPARSLNLLA